MIIFLLAALVSCLLGWSISWQVKAANSKQESSSLRSRLRYQLEKLNTFNVVENFPLGWLNVIIKYAWPGFIANLANNLTERLLSRLFENIMARQRKNAIMRRVHKLRLVEFSFGTVPPRFDTATARLTSNEQALELEMNIAYRSCGARLVVDAVLNAGGQEWPIRLNLDEFTLRGRLLLAFKLGWAAVPGIGGMEFTFVEKPELDFRISPIVTEVPGLTGQIRSALLGIIQNEAVEPARVFVDVRRAFDATVTQKQRGPRGQLRVTVAHATDLKPTADDVVPSHKELCVTYIELRMFGKIHTTPVAPQGNSPTWDWTISAPLQQSPVAQGADSVLHFTACNMAADAQPMTIGTAELRMDSLTAEELTRAEPHSAVVRLKPPKGKKGGGGRLFLTLHWDTEARGSAAPDNAASTQGSVQKEISFGHRHGQDAGPSGWQEDATGSADERSVDGESSGEHGDDPGLGWARLTQVARAEKMVNYDAFAQAQKIKELEAMLFYFRKTRSIEGQRALVEGAKFVLHRGWDTQVKLFWFDPTSQPPTIKWEASGAIHKMTKKGNSIKQHFNSQPANLMNGIAVGDNLFPEQKLGAVGSLMKVIGKSNPQSKARESRCFSILFEDSTALHLEVPETGNGRSRNEWVDAFKVILLKRSEGETLADLDR